MNNSFIPLLATKQNMDIAEVSMYIETFVFGFATELQLNHTVHFDPYGTFEVEKELEYIEEDDRGCKTLMPPCLKASFSSSAIYGILKSDEDEVENEIYQLFEERYEWGKEAISLFLAQIKSVIKSELLKNKVSYIPGFGTFEGELGGEISFLFDESFEKLINKPFAHFTPVQLACTERELANYTEQELKEAASNLSQDDDLVESPVPAAEETCVKTTAELAQDAHLNKPVDSVLDDNSSRHINVEQEMAHYSERIAEIEKKISTQDHVIRTYKRLALVLGLILIFVLGGWVWTTQISETNSSELIKQYEEEILVDEPQKTFEEMEEEIFRKWEDSIQALRDTVVSSSSNIILHDSVVDMPEKREVKTSDMLVINDTEMTQVDKMTHTLKSGETLRSLAYKYYKDREKWIEIYKSNSSIIANPDNIPVGTILTIPTIK